MWTSVAHARPLAWAVGSSACGRQGRGIWSGTPCALGVAAARAMRNLRALARVAAHAAPAATAAPRSRRGCVTRGCHARGQFAPCCARARYAYANSATIVSTCACVPSVRFQAPKWHSRERRWARDAPWAWRTGFRDRVELWEPFISPYGNRAALILVPFLQETPKFTTAEVPRPPLLTSVASRGV